MSTSQIQGKFLLEIPWIHGPRSWLSRRLLIFPSKSSRGFSTVNFFSRHSSAAPPLLSGHLLWLLLQLLLIVPPPLFLLLPPTRQPLWCTLVPHLFNLLIVIGRSKNPKLALTYINKLPVFSPSLDPPPSKNCQSNEDSCHVKNKAKKEGKTYFFGLVEFCFRLKDYQLLISHHLYFRKVFEHRILSLPVSLPSSIFFLPQQFLLCLISQSILILALMAL